MSKTFHKILCAVLSAALVLTCCVASSVSIQAASAGSLKLAPVFGDNMILQRNQKICIYGTGNGSGSITLGKTTKEVSSNSGSWQVYFDPMPASAEPITFSCDLSGHIRSYSDVLVGDVYVASGQSNMEFTVKSTEQATSAAYDSPNLRFSKGGSWKSFTKDSVQSMTAIGVLFAQELEKSLNKDIPIGIISASKGASRIDDWTSEEYCVCDKYCTDPHSDYTYYDQGHHDLYKNYIDPITDFSIAGVLWYQGESNRGIGEAKYYYDMFENMVDCWRNAWNDPDLPFYTVQIMLYTSDNGKDKNGKPVDEYNIRIAQGEAARTMKNVTMCSMLSYEDTVLPSGSMDIHPTDKAPIAKALANAALTEYYKPLGDYGKAPEYCGPLYKSVSLEKNTATVTFDHLGGGLMLKSGDTATEFEIRDAAGNWVSAKAELSGNTVVLSADIGTATGVRLGYRNSPRINLYNKAGYCASPFIFETDDYEMTHGASDKWTAGGDKHWKKCIADGCSERFDEQEHSGGEAGSCKTKNICDICGYAYGDYGPHAETEIRNAVAATETEEGYSGDTYCTDCKRLVSKGSAIPTLAQQRAQAGTETLVIVGIIVGAAVVIAAAVTTLILLKKKRAASKQKTEAE